MCEQILTASVKEIYGNKLREFRFLGAWVKYEAPCTLFSPLTELNNVLCRILYNLLNIGSEEYIHHSLYDSHFSGKWGINNLLFKE